MKKLPSLTILASTCGLSLLSSSPAHGQDQNQVQSRPPMSRFYLRGDAGAAVTQDTSIKEFFGESLAPGSRVVFDPGARFAVTAGYELTDWFSVEGQTGVMANRIDSITGASRVDDVFFTNVPLLANVRFQCPSHCLVTPYIGGGLGMSAIGINADHLDLGGTTMHGSEADIVFAYQAFGGLRFKLNDHMSVGLEYHYFATTDPSWKAHDTFGTSSDRLEFGGTATHTATVSFTYIF